MDVVASAGRLRVRVFGLVSVDRPPRDWEDDDVPQLDGWFLRAADVCSDQFWLGAYVDHDLQ